MLITVENGDTWKHQYQRSGTGKHYRPIEDIRALPDCSCMFKYPPATSKYFKIYVLTF